MPKLKIFGLSDTGMIRDNNEDRFWFYQGNGQTLLLVADGMGGHIGGELASMITVNQIKKLVKLNLGRQTPEDLLIDCLLLSDRAIREQSANQNSSLKMGTTCTLAFLSQVKKKDAANGKENVLEVSFIHIGDSRLYHIGQDGITQKSTDHTLLQRMLDSGSIKPEEASSFSQKNIIYKSLGGGDKLELDPVQTFFLQPGEMVILCSDGLSDYLKNSEILNILKSSSSIKKAASYLINLVNRRGGSDNITAVIAEYGNFRRHKDSQFDKIRPSGKQKCQRKKRNWEKIIMVSVLVLVLLGLLVLLGMRLIKEFSAFKAETAVTEEITTSKPKAENEEKNTEGTKEADTEQNGENQPDGDQANDLKKE
jgi:protein phosphatase